MKLEKIIELEKKVQEHLRKFINVLREGESGEQKKLSDFAPDLTSVVPNFQFTEYREPTDNKYPKKIEESLTEFLDIAPTTRYFKQKTVKHIMALYSIGKTANGILIELMRVTSPQADLSFSIFDSDFAEPLERLFYAECKKFNMDPSHEPFFIEWKNEMRDHYK